MVWPKSELNHCLYVLSKYFLADFLYEYQRYFRIEKPGKRKINFNFDLEEGCVAINGDEKGSPCVFPFNYRVNVGNVTVIGFEFKACTKYEHTQYWCSTKVDEYGNHIKGHWGDCAEECPNDDLLGRIGYLYGNIYLLASLTSISPKEKIRKSIISF